MKPIQTPEELKAWTSFREYLKQELKPLDGGTFFVSKEKLQFDLEGKPWAGHAVIAGPKAEISVKNLTKKGILFRRGTFARKGKDLAVDGLTPKLVKEAEKTLLKLRLGYKLAAAAAAADAAAAGTEDDADSDAAVGGAPDAKLQADWKKLKDGLTKRIRPALGGTHKKEIADLVKRATEQEKQGDFAAAIDSFKRIVPLLQGAEGELSARADKIDKAVKVWNRTEQAATSELRKLQKAILALNNPAGRAVIQGLEGILTRLDKVDDEAREAAEAAQRGDAAGFEKARDDFVKKMTRMLDYVEKDELIRDADSNPSVQIKIRETLSKSLNQLMKAV